MLKDIFEFSFSISDIVISPSIIVRALGYKNNSVPQPVIRSIEEILTVLPGYLKIRAGFRIINSFEISEKKDSFTIDNISFNSGSIIAKQLKKSTSVAIFTATAGHLLEQWSKELLKGEDILKGYIIDAIGSEVVEGAVDLLEIKLQNVIDDKGLKSTNRYSPGYCGWKVQEQHKLFSLLPKNFCGITLTSSALMIPIKSVSGVIGLGNQVKKLDYQCSICEMESCFRRKEK
ncbi:MAG: hypothetical protein NTX22_10520 [Ignavibacteriales bacterium]|nr:hypothetical protein [Ignavibacteriales bacterium]